MNLIDYVHPANKTAAKEMRPIPEAVCAAEYDRYYGKPIAFIFNQARDIRHDPLAYAFPRGNWSNAELAAALHTKASSSDTHDAIRAAIVGYVSTRAVGFPSQASFLATFRYGAPETAETLDESPEGFWIIEKSTAFRAMLKAQIEATDPKKIWSIEKAYITFEEIARTSTDDQTRTEALRELDVIAAIIGHRAVARRRSEQRRMKERAAFKLKQSKK